MRDLQFFLTHQEEAPAWVARKNPNIKGFNTQSFSSMSIGPNKVLNGNASVIIPDPGQPNEQIVIWGQEIRIPKDKSHLIVDGLKIDLPHMAESLAAEEKELSEQFAARFSNISTSPSLFSAQAARTTREERKQNYEQNQRVKDLQAQFQNEIVEKYFGKGAVSRMSITVTQQSVISVINADGTCTLSYKAGMMNGTRATGESVTVKDINESTTLQLAAAKLSSDYTCQ